MVTRKHSPQAFFSTEDKKRIVEAIREAERNTSGEIRVYLERKAGSDVIERAKKVFEKIGMARTARRNGVLIYFSLSDHQFALLGDQGIDEKVGPDFWSEAASEMEEAFSRGRFVEGLQAAVRRVGEKLQTYFIYEAGDTNELPDKV